MTKHTPGPWKVTTWDKTNAVDGFETVITDNRGHGLATFTQFGNNAKVNANARLIAAAPELLQALQGFLYRYPNNVGSAQARALIAEATGHG